MWFVGRLLYPFYDAQLCFSDGNGVCWAMMEWKVQDTCNNIEECRLLVAGKCDGLVGPGGDGRVPNDNRGTRESHVAKEGV